MILLTPKLRARLLANLARGADPVPAVKFFNPLGPRRGRQESRMKTGDTSSDLGLGRLELDSLRLSEIESQRPAVRLGHRDISV